MRYLLGIDIGTSGTKTILYDEKGNETAVASQGYPMYQPKNGWAEQKPQDWWDAVCATAREVLHKSGIGRRHSCGRGQWRVCVHTGCV